MKLPEVGQRIKLVEMGDDPNPIPVGTCGTVTRVQAFASPMSTSRSTWDQDHRPTQTQLPAQDVLAQVEVDWDNGRGLFLVLPADKFEYL